MIIIVPRIVMSFISRRVQWVKWTIRHASLSTSHRVQSTVSTSSNLICIQESQQSCSTKRDKSKPVKRTIRMVVWPMSTFVVWIKFCYCTRSNDINATDGWSRQPTNVDNAHQNPHPAHEITKWTMGQQQKSNLLSVSSSPRHERFFTQCIKTVHQNFLHQTDTLWTDPTRSVQWDMRC